MNPAKDVFSCQRDVNQRAKPAATWRFTYCSDSAWVQVDAIGRNDSRTLAMQKVGGFESHDPL
jgi:hypothetical protein